MKISENILRNPVIQIGNVEVLNIGDPHLGKAFNQAFPDRRKDIVEHQWKVFKYFICHAPQKIKVICGDIFDKSKVDESVLLRTAEILNNASGEVIILEGNHDSSKTTLEKTSFDVLTQLVSPNPNIKVVRGIETKAIGGELVTFIGWEYHHNIREQIEQNGILDVEYYYTHVDFESFNQDKSNTVPFDLLKQYGAKYVINGHEHLPKRSHIDGIDYIGTGSILPFDRSQQHESDQNTYADLFVNVYQEDQDYSLDYIDKFVYFHSSDFCEVPEFIGSYGVILKKVTDLEEDKPVVLEFDEISIPQLLSKAAEITGLDSDSVKQLVEEFEKVESE